MSQVLATAPASASEGRERLAFMDSFRALAIMAVVIAHSAWVAWGSEYGASSALDFLMNIVAGPTTLFVFISGFMFHHVFYARFDYGRFMLGKLKTVVAPYAVVTAILTLYMMAYGEGPYRLSHYGIGEVADFYNRFMVSLVTGQTGFAMWYVPFIVMVFLLSPCVMAFAAAPEAWRRRILLIALAAGILAHRSFFNSDKLQNLVHFAFFYLFGVYCSLHKAAFLRLCSGPLTLAASTIVVVNLAVAQFAAGGLGPVQATFFHWVGLDLNYLQKIGLVICLCSLFLVLPRLNGGWLRIVARDSFGIFFAHNLVVALFLKTGWPAMGLKWVDLAAASATVFVISHLIVLAVRAVAGPMRSRYLIGA